MMERTLIKWSRKIGGSKKTIMNEVIVAVIEKRILIKRRRTI